MRRILGTLLAVVLVVVGGASAASAEERTLIVAAGTPTVVDVGVDTSVEGMSWYSHNPNKGVVHTDWVSTMTYVPNEGFYGSDTFVVGICVFGTSTCRSVTYLVTVVPPLSAVDDAFVVDANGSLYENVRTNDLGAPTNIGFVTEPTNGSAAIHQNGDVQYTPAPGFSGTDSFVYFLSDDDTTVTATATITVRPVAAADALTTTTGQPVSGHVLGNDAGSGLQASLVSSPAYGTVVLAVDGGLTYTPAPRFAGTDSFTYSATDASGQNSVATVVVAVSPVAADDAFVVQANGVTGGDVLANDASEGVAVLATSPSHGSVTLYPSGTFGYQPTSGFSGDDVFTYDLVANGLRTSATVTIAVLPTAGDATAQTSAGVPVSGSLADVAVGSDLTFTLSDGADIGTIELAADGSYTYTPGPGASGYDALRYVATDGAGRSATASLMIEITPVAVDDDVTTPADTMVTGDVLENDAARDGEVSLLDGPTHGSVDLSVWGQFAYTPAEGWSGTDTFTYQVDSYGMTATATVTVTVTPVAVDDAFVVSADVPTWLDVVGNDTGDALELTGVTQPEVGEVAVVDGGVEVWAPAGYVGELTFTYEVADATGQTTTATVTLGVSVPVSGGDALVGVPGQPAVFTPLDNDAPTEGAEWILESLGLVDPATGDVLTRVEVAEGVWEVLADGSVRFTPASASVEGAVAIDYLVMDTAGGVAGATLEVTYPAAPVPPTPPVDEPGTPAPADPVTPGTPAVPPTGEPLATTGADLAGAAALAVVLAMLGAALVLVTRRRAV